MKQFIRKSWHRACSLLLVLTLSLGGTIIWNVETTSATETTELREISLQYTGYESKEEYLSITLTTQADISGHTFTSTENQIMLDGALLTSDGEPGSWSYFREANASARDVELRIPYRLFGEDITKDNVLATRHSIVILKGSSIGSGLQAATDVAMILNSEGVQSAVPATLDVIKGIAQNVDSGNKRYLITLTDEFPTDWGNIWQDTGCKIDEKNADIAWANLDNQLIAILQYETLDPAIQPDYANEVGYHLIEFLAGTVIGKAVLTKSCTIEIDGNTVAKAPDVVLKSQVYANDSNGAKEVNLIMDQEDKLAVTWDVEKSFMLGGVDQNGSNINTGMQFKKTDVNQVYNLWFNGENLPSGTIITLDGKIKENDYVAKFERARFKYQGGVWTEYTPTPLAIQIKDCVRDTNTDALTVTLDTSTALPKDSDVKVIVNGEIKSFSVTNQGDEGKFTVSGSLDQWKKKTTIFVKAQDVVYPTSEGTEYDMVQIETGSKIYFQHVTLGDANDDGMLTLKDMVRMRRYLTNQTTSIGKGADVVCDDIIQSEDYGALCSILLQRTDYAERDDVWKTLTRGE